MYMEWRMAGRLMLRWSIATAALLAAFWSAWFWANGSVPHSGLDGELSRWADIAIGPIWSCAGVLAVALLGKAQNAVGVAAVCWVPSLALALCIGIVPGLMLGGMLLAFFGALALVLLAVWIIVEGLSRIPPLVALGRWLSGD